MVTRVLLLTAGFVFWVTLAVAQGNSQGKGHGKGNPHNASDPSSVSISFGIHDREIIREYYRDQYSNLPPGLAKRGGNLPPGLQKHLERDGTLPPGLQKRVTPFPCGIGAETAAASHQLRLRPRVDRPDRYHPGSQVSANH